MVTPILDTVRRFEHDQTLGALALVVEGPGIGGRAMIEAGAGYVAGSMPDEIAGDVLDNELVVRDVGIEGTN